ncbi:mechanosensitive ion channel family protein [Salinirubellus salinus]|uniref:Mechanosensitive ion channel family protein n=1 Tax=Salinirubellus salinus TaxID=1364945 RepID=A0A9E7R5X9_9EURY|nr:mechanosensitive ion channel family protein [Salinirubellus salinus]UWM56510.1 mechanosensitive ion channel family protein [Salinirubellus salinus]
MPPDAFQVVPPTVEDAVEPYSELVGDVTLFVTVALVVYLLGRLLVVPGAVRVVRMRNRNNPTLVTATETYLSVVIAGIAIFAGLVASGQAAFLVSTDSAILIAALTFAFGVAGQEVFGSLISGIFLVADPDFNVGDWISWPGGEGYVEAVDFRVTRIRTIDNETITVPNTQLTTNALTRPFGRDSYRVTERIFVSYAEDTERALMELRTLAGAHDRVLEEPTPTTRIVDLGENSITLRAEFWVDDPDGGGIVDVRSDFRRRVKRHFDEEGITLAPPSAQSVTGAIEVARTDGTDAGE